MKTYPVLCTQAKQQRFTRIMEILDSTLLLGYRTTICDIDRRGILEAPLMKQTLTPNRQVNRLPTPAEEGAEETWIIRCG